jgi:hypothetical protein
VSKIHIECGRVSKQNEEREEENLKQLWLAAQVPHKLDHVHSCGTLEMTPSA